MEARTSSCLLAIEEFHSGAKGNRQTNFMQNTLCIINTWQLQDWLRAHHYKCLFTEIIAIQIRKPTENNGSATMLTRTEVRVKLF